MNPTQVSHVDANIADLAAGDTDVTRKWVAAIEDYCEWLRGGDAAEKTIEQRRYQLSLLAEEHISRSPWRVSGDDLSRWLASYDWAPGTRATYRSTVRSFYNWAVETSRTKRNPAGRLPSRRVPAGLPRPTPDSVVDAALARANDRDRLMLMLAMHAGLRRTEIATLRWEQIGPVEMRITGKGRRTRIITVTPQLRAELDAEQARRDGGEFGTGYYFRRHADGVHVFPGRFGGHLRPETVGAALSHLLGPGWSGHTLRHRFGTRFYERSGDIRLTSEALGHQRLETTAGYAALPSEAMRDVMVSLWDD